MTSSILTRTGGTDWILANGSLACRTVAKGSLRWSGLLSLADYGTDGTDPYGSPVSPLHTENIVSCFKAKELSFISDRFLERKNF